MRARFFALLHRLGWHDWYSYRRRGSSVYRTCRYCGKTEET